ncbi:MAG: deoxyribodipyrimidine photo-lyase [Gammaproteobacteria bacterium]
MMAPTLVWLRQDLRLDDNPALKAAQQRKQPVIPVYILDPDSEGDWAPASASRYWLHQSLRALDEQLQTCGSRLILRQGDSLAELQQLAKQTGAEAVYWNRRYEPAVVKRDATIKQQLLDQDIDAQSFNGALLHEPPQTKNKQGKPFRVFTPFWKHCRSLGEPEPPVAGVRKLAAPDKWPDAVTLEKLALEPAIDWAGGIAASWEFGAKAAEKALDDFLAEGLNGYPTQRDFPGKQGVSVLSPRLHFGELSPRQIWQRVREFDAGQGRVSETTAAEKFLRQLGWREFGHHLLYHFPHTTDKPLNETYADFPWRKNAKALRAWQRGRTGYPIVDAGMRQLWHTGYMHNRVRMVVASFLVKDLLIHWRDGACWFWDTLVDADLANNTLGWQWAAGCGADAAPYFRIFNPVLQSQRFDADGAYIRRWVPELAELNNKAIHEPWQADSSILKAANVKLGDNYPQPIVDHKQARQDALAALKTITGKR